MNYTYKIKDNTVEVRLFGEIDHHNARKVREGIDQLIEGNMPRYLYLDLSEITFCDSSGLGLVMGRMKKAAQYKTTLIIVDPSPAVSRILNIAGMDKLLKIVRKKVV